MASPAQETRPEQSTTESSPVMPFQSLGGRKFVLVAGAAMVYTALLICGYVDQAAYLNLQVMTLGAYIAGNTVQKFAHNDPNQPR